MKEEKSINQKNTDEKKKHNPDYLTAEELAEQIRNLDGQEFFMSIPIGGETNGR